MCGDGEADDAMLCCLIISMEWGKFQAILTRLHTILIDHAIILIFILVSNHLNNFVLQSTLYCQIIKDQSNMILEQSEIVRQLV